MENVLATTLTRDLYMIILKRVILKEAYVDYTNVLVCVLLNFVEGNMPGLVNQWVLHNLLVLKKHFL